MNELVAKRLQVAQRAAKEAGEFLIRTKREIAVELKGDRDWVTNADRGSEEIIRQILQREFPDDFFFGEESGATDKDVLGSLDQVWIVDPLDGTTNYVRGFADYGISIAFYQGGRPIIGVIAAPEKDELFQAVEGCGAYLNNQPIRVSQVSSLIKALVGTGFPYEPDEHGGNNTDHVANMVPLVHDLRRMGAAALDLASVACGRLDGFWEFGLSAWDVAAGILLVQEAGGTVTDFLGEPVNIFARRIVASNKVIHQSLLKTLSAGQTGFTANN